MQPKDERAAIVAWLRFTADARERGQAKGAMPDYEALRIVAWLIEEGAHWEPRPAAQKRVVVFRPVSGTALERSSDDHPEECDCFPCVCPEAFNYGMP